MSDSKYDDEILSDSMEKNSDRTRSGFVLGALLLLQLLTVVLLVYIAWSLNGSQLNQQYSRATAGLSNAFHSTTPSSSLLFPQKATQPESATTVPAGSQPQNQVAEPPPTQTRHHHKTKKKKT